MTQFKNDATNDLVEVMERHRAAFEAKHKGQNWRAIMFTIADTFPEDRLAIFQMFQPTPVQPNENPPSLTRASKKGVQQVDEDCEGCPKSNAHTGSGNNPAGSHTRVIKKGAEFTSSKDVEERFESNVDAMLAFAKERNILISGKVTSPKTIATKIFEHSNAS